MLLKPIRSFWWAGVAKWMVALVLGALFALSVVQLTQASANEAGATPTNRPDFAAIDRYVQEEMEATRLPGVALGIVKGDEIVHLKGFGEADPSGRSVTPQTPFIIGSTTKSFTALAIMQLFEAGEVELDAPVQRYLPWFRVADPEASARITVRHLLNHTSGLSEATGMAYLLKEDASENALENGVHALSTVDLNRPVGETFEYSNLNYTVLGLIVQTVSAEPYEQYVQERILTPLEMNNSFAFPPEAERHGLATGHRFWFGRPFSGGGLPHNRAATPAGFISSSAEDMSHYLIAQLNEGRYGDEEVLSPEGIAELHRPAVSMMGEEADPSYSPSYAMGWGVEEIGGVQVVRHTGSTGDFHADMILLPKAEWGIVLLTNGEDSLQMGRIGRITLGVTDLLVGRGSPPVPAEPMRTIFFEPVRAIFFVVLGGARSRSWGSPGRRCCCGAGAPGPSGARAVGWR